MRVVFASVIIALAGRVAAHHVPSTPNTLLTLPVTEMLVVPPELNAACGQVCQSTVTTFTNCGDGDPNDPLVSARCICLPQVATDLKACEQCMYDELARIDKPMPNPTAGSATILSNYGTFCIEKLNLTTTPGSGFEIFGAMGLALPPNWLGPNSLELPVPVAGVYVAVAAILGVGCISIVNTM